MTRDVALAMSSGEITNARDRDEVLRWLQEEKDVSLAEATLMAE
jgi:hypothetical protein